jgi:hypothetical protein
MHPVLLPRLALLAWQWIAIVETRFDCECCACKAGILGIHAKR